MPLDDTTWTWAPTIAPAGNNQAEVAPAENTKIAPAGSAGRAGGEQVGRRVAAGGGYQIAPAEHNQAAPASSASCAGGEQSGPPAPTETDPTTTAVLIRARALIERGWCRFAFALNADGGRVWVKSERAVAWCMHGALTAAAADVYANADAIGRVQAAIGGETMTDFNDRQESVEPVLAAFDRAIRSAAPAATEAPRTGVQIRGHGSGREMQAQQTRRAGERPALPTMTNGDLDEFLTLVGGETDETEAEGYRFWRCPRCKLYALTNDPSRMMGEPCSLCERTDRARCVGRPVCQTSCRGCVVIFCRESIDG